MDALVAKALNSTVGSDNFYGLDRLLTKEAVRLMASNELFYKYDGGYTSVNNGGTGSNTQWMTHTKYVQLDASGTAAIDIILEHSMSGGTTIELAVKDGSGNSVYSKSASASDMKNISFLLNVDKSKKYRLECSYKNTGAYLKILAFDTYATPVFGAVFGKTVD